MHPLALAATLAVTSPPSPAPSPPPSAPQSTPKVLVIGIDGLRADALAPAATPHLDALAADGALTLDAQVGPITVSGPGWSSFLTGVWSDRHGVHDNSFSGANYGAWPDFLTRIEREAPQLRTAAFVSWLPLADELFEGLDVEGAWTYTANGDALVRDAAAHELATNDPDALFVYFADLDVEGHTTGFSPTNPLYLAELTQIDGYIGDLLAALRGRATYEQEDWLVLVASDHGGLGTGHSGGLPVQRTIPFLASGPSVSKGARLAPAGVTSVAASALAHLGLAPRSFGLDGTPLAADGRRPLRLELLPNGDAEWSSGNGAFTPERSCPGWRDVSPFTIVRYGAPSMPTATDPGPPVRGANLFIGGATASNSEVRRDIDLGAHAALIDAGRLHYELSGWLGGVGAQNDQCAVLVSFHDAAGAVQRADAIGPVSRAERVLELGGPVTGLLPRSTSGPIPAGVRRALVRVVAYHTEGPTNEACADELSLRVTLAPGGDCNQNGVDDALDVLFGTSLDANSNLVPDECECDTWSDCSTAPNTVGPGASLRAAGGGVLGTQPLALTASGLPPGAPGLVLAGRSATRAPLADGWLCIGAPIVRLGVAFADAGGVAHWSAPSAWSLGPSALPAVGEAWRFQLWYRDASAAGANLSHAVVVRFCQ